MTTPAPEPGVDPCPNPFQSKSELWTEPNFPKNPPDDSCLCAYSAREASDDVCR